MKRFSFPTGSIYIYKTCQCQDSNEIIEKRDIKKWRTNFRAKIRYRGPYKPSDEGHRVGFVFLVYFRMQEMAHFTKMIIQGKDGYPQTEENDDVELLSGYVYDG